jgi:hypothetical protein
MKLGLHLGSLTATLSGRSWPIELAWVGLVGEGPPNLSDKGAMRSVPCTVLWLGPSDVFALCAEPGTRERVEGVLGNGLVGGGDCWSVLPVTLVEGT